MGSIVSMTNLYRCDPGRANYSSGFPDIASEGCRSTLRKMHSESMFFRAVLCVLVATLVAFAIIHRKETFMLHAILTIAGAIAFCLLYLVGRMCRAVLAWGNRDPEPRERVGFYLVIAAAFGATAGWLAYEPFVTIQQCRAAGEPVISCALFSH
jgi:amino acid transporter